MAATLIAGRIRRGDLGAAVHDYDRPQPPPFVRTFGRDRRSAWAYGSVDLPPLRDLASWDGALDPRNSSNSTRSHLARVDGLEAVIFAAREPVSLEGTRRPAREQLEEAGFSASKRGSPARL